MILRKVTFDDWKILLDWRNDPITIKYSINQEKVEEEHHKNWLKHNINNNFYIAEVNNEPIGTIRKNLNNANEWVLSWTISPNHRGMGYGTKMLKEFLKSFSANDKIKAFILKENIASLNMAKKCGFDYVQSETEIFELEYKKMTDFEIIDAIQGVRNKNNVNWMNILRIAFK